MTETVIKAFATSVLIAALASGAICPTAASAQTIRARGLDNARTRLIATEKVVAVSPAPSGIYLFTPAGIRSAENQCFSSR